VASEVIFGGEIALVTGLFTGEHPGPRSGQEFLDAVLAGAAAEPAPA
jgi:hypothetical protein